MDCRSRDLAAILVCVLGFNALKPKTVAGAKTINVTVVNEIDGTELFSGEIKTDAETLGKMLEEAPELKAENGNKHVRPAFNCAAGRRTGRYGDWPVVAVRIGK